MPGVLSQLSHGDTNTLANRSHIMNGKKRKRSTAQKTSQSNKRKRSEEEIDNAILEKYEALKEDPSYYCGGILDEMMETWKRLEKNASLLPAKNYFEFQDDVRMNFRKRLFDWIIQVHAKLKLRPATLHLATNLFDRFMCLKQMHRKQLQMLGSCCLFLSSKYHDIHCLSGQMLVNLADGAFNYQELLDCEIAVVHGLKFNLTVPTSLTFLQQLHLLTVDHPCHQKLVYASSYLCELLVFDPTLIQVKPSEIASVAMAWALNLVVNESWNAEMSRLSGYQWSSLQKYGSKIQVLTNNKSCTIHIKYSISKRHRVSKLFLADMIQKKLELYSQ